MSLALSSTDGGAALKAKGEAPKTCRVRFWLKFHVDYGQTIKIIGSHASTGGGPRAPGASILRQQLLFNASFH